MLELSIAAESIYAITNLLVIALGLSSLVCLAFVVPLLRRRLQLGPRLELLGKVLLAGLTSLQAFAWHLYFYRQSHDAVELGYLGFAVVIGAVLWQVTTVSPTKLPRRLARWLPTGIACLAVLQLVGFAVATKCFAEFQPASPIPVVALPEVVVAEKAVALTDLEHKLKLYERTASQEEFQSFVNHTRKSMSAVIERAMLRNEAHIGSNCHGWVFTGGRFIVQCEDVPTILDENGYFEVPAPELNDVVVYRSDAGDVLHTGIVRGFLDGDAALVESKWGAEGTYLHLAEEQPYSQNISYWHTDRGSHLLKIVPAQPD